MREKTICSNFKFSQFIIEIFRIFNCFTWRHGSPFSGSETKALCQGGIHFYESKKLNVNMIGQMS